MHRTTLRFLGSILAITIPFAGCSEDKDKRGGDKAGAAAEGGEGAAPQTVRVTGIPDENPTELQRKYKPMVDYLEQELGATVEYVPVTDYGAAVQALSAGKVDFAWLGGFTHVLARNMSDAEPLCMREIDRNFKSAFIANAEGGIESMADLKGKSFAFGSKSSTSGHLMPRHFLVSEHGIDPDKDFDGKPVFSGAHDATAKMVESGRVQAGALNFEVWQRMVDEESVDTDKVRVIWKTPGYVDYVWTARSGLAPELKEKFKNALLELDPDDPKQTAVLELQGAKKFVSARSSDFDAIEAIAKEVGLIKE